MDKVDKMLITIMTLCVFSLGFLVSEIIEITPETIFEESNTPNRIPLSEQEIILNCKNLTLRDTAFCFRDNIELFYNYTITDDEIAKTMTLDEIKELGGDCGSYAYLYERLAKEIGFNATTNRYAGVKDVHPAHRWAEIWDNEMWCELDQLGVNCRDIENG